MRHFGAREQVKVKHLIDLFQMPDKMKTECQVTEVV